MKEVVVMKTASTASNYDIYKDLNFIYVDGVFFKGPFSLG